MLLKEKQATPSLIVPELSSILPQDIAETELPRPTKTEDGEEADPLQVFADAAKREVSNAFFQKFVKPKAKGKAKATDDDAFVPGSSTAADAIAAGASDSDSDSDTRRSAPPLTRKKGESRNAPSVISDSESESDDDTQKSSSGVDNTDGEDVNMNTNAAAHADTDTHVEDETHAEDDDNDMNVDEDVRYRKRAASKGEPWHLPLPKTFTGTHVEYLTAGAVLLASKGPSNDDLDLTDPALEPLNAWTDFETITPTGFYESLKNVQRMCPDPQHYALALMTYPRVADTAKDVLDVQPAGLKPEHHALFRSALATRFAYPPTNAEEEGPKLIAARFLLAAIKDIQFLYLLPGPPAPPGI